MDESFRVGVDAFVFASGEGCVAPEGELPRGVEVEVRSVVRVGGFLAPPPFLHGQ
jgi:hypothetical protein